MAYSQPEQLSILIVIPVFNDWEALEILLINIDKNLYGKPFNVDILIVDDASTTPVFSNFISTPLKEINKIEILELRRNIGHQRAIAIGLSYIEENLYYQAVVIMDGDGEDDPKDVIKLIEECHKQDFQKVIFARRSKRSETWLFKLFYIFYKHLYKLLTGHHIRVGNFSIIPHKIIPRLVVVSELWNHYAVGLLKAKVPYAEIYSKRGNRLAGKPKMNFVSLITHGLSAISVYGDVVGVRLLIASIWLILFTLIAIVAAIIVKLFSNLAIPGWTSYIVILFFIILMQSVMLSLFFSFLILSGRNNSSFLPKRDYHYFILGIRQVFPRL
ncbi:MAG TPA: glycosyltransferase [Leptolyngbyaceae cyanobacterium]